MAIKVEKINNFYHSYSDEGYRIRQVDTGLVYDDAMDVEQKEYEETEEKIMSEEVDFVHGDFIPNNVE